LINILKINQKENSIRNGSKKRFSRTEMRPDEKNESMTVLNRVLRVNKLKREKLIKKSSNVFQKTSEKNVRSQKKSWSYE